MRWRTVDRSYRSRLAEERLKPPHEVLGVAAQCSPDEARRAYLALVRTYHPDRADPFMAQYNEEMLKIVNLAYERLTTREV